MSYLLWYLFPLLTYFCTLAKFVHFALYHTSLNFPKNNLGDEVSLKKHSIMSHNLLFSSFLATLRKLTYAGFYWSVTIANTISLRNMLRIWGLSNILAFNSASINFGNSSTKEGPFSYPYETSHFYMVRARASIYPHFWSFVATYSVLWRYMIIYLHLVLIRINKY